MSGNNEPKYSGSIKWYAENTPIAGHIIDPKPLAIQTNDTAAVLSLPCVVSATYACAVTGTVKKMPLMRY